jgi:hypothetical protein
MTISIKLALNAWKNAMGDAMTAVWLLRNSTDLSLREAFELIQKTAHQVGGRCNLHLVGANQLPAEFVEQIAYDARERDVRLAEHRAARGVKKVRGAK